MDKISKPFIKESRKGFTVFDFEQERWLRIAKLYSGIPLVFLFIIVFGSIILFRSLIILLISYGVFILGLNFLSKTFIPKKYRLKTVKINRKTIEFTYDNYKDKALLPFPKDEIRLIVHTAKDRLELEYEGHIMNFKKGSDLTIFLDNLVSRLRLEFDKSLETGVNQEVLHYKVIPKNSKNHQN